MRMKPIQTQYRGYLFRSRLEARWAVFFDACGVEWEYEAEGYDLGMGLSYLPDFLLHGVQLGGYGNGSDYSQIQDLYVEVKGLMSQKDSEKIAALYQNGIIEGLPSLSETPVLVLGNIPVGKTVHEIQAYTEARSCKTSRDFPMVRPFNFETVDGMDCVATPCVNRDGHLELFGYAKEYNRHYIDCVATERAYRLARQARFEHGEKPEVRRECHA
ncbi:hypothetical protein MKD04_05890 [[Clostridium] innocuum]|nr:hypothetical protein [[Clostridium] innocuum]MCR0502951.1 hypothetical protein [[Clostridium] innocuum]DAY94031.1 MAG TPA: endodeoxyribonuclease I [Caudoviricetes sp.]